MNNQICLLRSSSTVKCLNIKHGNYYKYALYVQFLLILVNTYILTNESHSCDIKIILLIYVDDEYTIYSRFILFDNLFKGELQSKTIFKGVKEGYTTKISP